MFKLSQEEHKSGFLTVKPSKTSLKYVKEKVHHLHSLICPENFCLKYNHTISEGL